VVQRLKLGASEQVNFSPAVERNIVTRPRSKAEATARSNGYEYRHVYQQGPGAAKAARVFTHRQSSKAMRRHNKKMAVEALSDLP
jgi:hypothetical protein